MNGVPSANLIAIGLLNKMCASAEGSVAEKTAEKTPEVAAPLPVAVEPTPVTTEQANATEQTGICKGLNLENTAEQGECLDRKFAQSDQQLNETYKQLMAGLDDVRKVALKKEQIAWIKDKETKCAQAGKEVEGGTLEPVVIADCKVQTTEQRLAYLKAFK